MNLGIYQSAFPSMLWSHCLKQHILGSFVHRDNIYYCWLLLLLVTITLVLPAPNTWGSLVPVAITAAKFALGSLIKFHLIGKEPLKIL